MKEYNLTARQKRLLTIIVENIKVGKDIQPLVPSISLQDSQIIGIDHKFERTLLSDLDVLCEEGLLSAAYNSVGGKTFTVKKSGFDAVANNFGISESGQGRSSNKKNGDTQKVFIVHGHDERNLRRLRDLLRTRWGINPIVMSSQPGKGRTLIEKFEEEAQQTAYAIVLMTPDDLIQLERGDYTQARPNVIFELGWFYGRLGRSKVCILFKRGNRIHSDLDGISRIEFAESVAETRDELERELLDAGVLRLSKIIPILLSELKDKRSSKIRAKAARALGKIGGPEVLPDLREATKDDSPGVQSAANAAIEEIKSKNE